MESAMTDTSSSLTAHVAEFITRTKAKAIPAEVMHLGKRSILDGIGLALAGSVAEWVLDSPASFSEDPAVDPADLSSEDVRVMKGGAFQDRPGRVRGAARDSNRADSRAIGLGFRCARQP